MGGRLFLHGGGNNKNVIIDCISEFIGGKRSVSVLFANCSDELFEKIKKTWISLRRDQAIHFIRPIGGSVLLEDVDKIKKSDAIFFNGGDTKEYYNLYSTILMRKILSNMVNTDFAGSSAGALLMSKFSTICGNTIRGENNSYMLNSININDGQQNSEVPLLVARGLNLLGNISIDVHATQWGRLPRLFETLKTVGTQRGIAIDEDTYLVVEDGHYMLRGAGRAYFVKKCRNSVFHVKAFTAADKIPYSIFDRI